VSVSGVGHYNIRTHLIRGVYVLQLHRLFVIAIELALLNRHGFKLSLLRCESLYCNKM